MGAKFRVSICILVCLVILCGFFGIVFTSLQTYTKFIEDDIKNISKLVATNVYSDIRNELTKPVFVSLTMANDSFLKQWLEFEPNEYNYYAHQEELVRFLCGIKSKYKYDAVFLISDATKTYYYFDGINKIIRPDNKHDQWYYSFIDRARLYEIDIDTDETNENCLSVFVNCRITNDEGKLLGVTGVGLEISKIQDLLFTFQNEYQLDVDLCDSEGIIQIDSDTSNIGIVNVFDNAILKKNKSNILSNSKSVEIFQDQGNPYTGYYITRYIDDLEWYLVVKKDTTMLETIFYKQIVFDIVIYIVVVLAMILIIIYLIRKNECKLSVLSKTDLLTQLLNRRGFNEHLERKTSETLDDRSLFVFVFDIDNFKCINDKYGHLFGDKVLISVGNLALGIFSNTGVVARWGGDEFAGYIEGLEEEIIKLADTFFHELNTNFEYQSIDATVSMGLTKTQPLDTAESIIYRADSALYLAKESGKNRYILV